MSTAGCISTAMRGSPSGCGGLSVQCHLVFRNVATTGRAALQSCAGRPRPAPVQPVTSLHGPAWTPAAGLESCPTFCPPVGKVSDIGLPGRPSLDPSSTVQCLGISNTFLQGSRSDNQLTAALPHFWHALSPHRSRPRPLSPLLDPFDILVCSADNNLRPVYDRREG
jgi:hypothetical protein